MTTRRERDLDQDSAPNNGLEDWDFTLFGDYSFFVSPKTGLGYNNLISWTSTLPPPYYPKRFLDSKYENGFVSPDFLENN